MSTKHKEHKDCFAPSLILDYESSLIQGVLSDLKKTDGIIEQSIAAYLFVQDRILFGYNPDRESIPASQALCDGIGHCDNKERPSRRFAARAGGTLPFSFLPHR